MDSASLEWVARLARTFPVAVIATDVAGSVVVWSSMAEHIYGWRAEEAVGRPISELTIHPLDHGVADEIMSSVIGGKPWAGRYHARTKAGDVVEVYVVDVPVYASDGTLTGIVGCSQTSMNTEPLYSPRWVALRHVASEINAHRERERAEAARRLHDDIGQVLAMMRMEIQGIRDLDDLGDFARHRIDRMEGDLDLAIRSVRELTDELALHNFDVWTLVIRMFELADDVNRRGLAVAECGVGVEVDDLRQIAPDVAYVAYNLVREAVFNAMRHSSCGGIQLRLRVANARLIVEVRDDGIGVSGSVRGHGQMTMADRVDSVGGVLEIKDRSDDGLTGTTVTASFPLEMGGAGR